MTIISKHILLLAILFIHLSQFSLAQTKFWVQTNGPTGGRVMAVTIDASGKLYCGTQGGTVFQYSNKNQSWKPLFLGSTRQNIISIVTGTQGHIYFATSNDGIFRCIVQSNTFKKISTGLEDLEITGLGILPDGTLFTGTKSGLYKSVNRGKNWIKVEPLSGPINILRVYKHIIYIVSSDSLLSYSIDGGQNWEKLQALESISFRSLAIGNDQHVYAGTTKGEVFQYGKRNHSWEKIAHFDFSIWVLEADPNGNIFAGLGGPAFSIDGGGVYLIPANREKPKLLFDKSTISIWCMAIRNNVVYAGTYEGIYYSSENKTQWLPLDSGLIAQRVNDIVINKNDVLFVGSYGGVFRSDDNGDSWIKMNNGLDEIGIVDMAINKKGDLFAGTYTSSIFRSTDSGNSWQKKSSGIPAKNWIMNLAINSRNEIFAATSNAGIYRSLDNGDTWHPVHNGLEDPFYNSGEEAFYNTLVIDSKDVVFAANTKGNVFRSENNGETWQKMQAKNPIDDPPAELMVDSENQLYFGAVEKGVFRYSGKDQTWTQLNNGLLNTTIRSLIITSGGSIFTGTSGAKDYKHFIGEDLYKSIDRGQNWSLINSGLDHPRIKALAVNSKGTLFAGTWGGGVYKSLYPVALRKNK